MKIEFTKNEIYEIIATLITWRDEMDDNSVNPLIKKLQIALECPFE